MYKNSKLVQIKYRYNSQFNNTKLKTVYISDTITLENGDTISIGNNKYFFGKFPVKILKIGTTSNPLSTGAIIAIIVAIIIAISVGVLFYLYKYKK